MPTDGSALPDPKPRMRGGIGRPKGKHEETARLYGKARTQTFIRAAGVCEAFTPACTRYATQCHHVLPRARGGKHEPANLLLVCLSCHEFIHAHPAISRQAGWLK